MPYSTNEAFKRTQWVDQNGILLDPDLNELRDEDGRITVIKQKDRWQFKTWNREEDREEATPRKLPVKSINGKKYFEDDRLGEFRNVKNPHDRIDFEEYGKEFLYQEGLKAGKTVGKTALKKGYTDPDEFFGDWQADYENRGYGKMVTLSRKYAGCKDMPGHEGKYLNCDDFHKADDMLYRFEDGAYESIKETFKRKTK